LFIKPRLKANKEQALRKSEREAWRYTLPFFLLVVFLLALSLALVRHVPTLSRGDSLN
jgi:lipopolysaccharide export LptBFGC system permease protein LptF